MSKLADRVYAVSPLWIQKAGINAFGWYWARRRLGGEFERFAQEYRDREQWSPERMREYIDAQLQSLLLLAYREVPFYRRSFSENGLTETVLGKLRSDDLGKVPFLDKAIVRRNSKVLLRENIAAKPPASFATSGTTGTPIRVYWDAATHQHNAAVREVRSFGWAGVSYRQSRSMIGGRLVIPKAQATAPFWRYNRWEKQLYLSAFHISPATAPAYASALNQYKPMTMAGYASANFFLARFIEETGVQVHSPKAIITGSEPLLPHMRSLLERVYRTRAYEEYGSVENCALATECEHGRMHVHVDFGILEILRPDGTPAGPGETGEIVVTGFANRNQIFIRYRIGDVAAWSGQKCSCGREALPVITDLVGRQEDTVVGPDGREMVRFHGLFIDLPGVTEGQLIQRTSNQFTVNVVPTPTYTDADAEAIRARMRTRLGTNIDVDVALMDSIPREANGKFRAVISKVRRQQVGRTAPGMRQESV